MSGPDPKKSSGHQPGFSMVENQYFDSKCHAALCRFSLSAAAILQILRRYKNNKTGWAYPSFKQIVIDSGLNKNTVWKAMNVLTRFRLIEKKQAGQRFHFRMQYRIIDYDRLGYEKIAGTIHKFCEQSRKIRVIPKSWEQSKKQKTAKNAGTIPKIYEQSKKAPCTIPKIYEHGTIPKLCEHKDLKKTKKTIKKEKNNVSLSKTKVKREQTTTQKLSQKTKTKITPKKLSAEFDKTKDAGEKAFKTFAEEIQAKSKMKSASQKTFEGKQNARIP